MTPTNPSIARTVAAGLAAGLTINLLMLLTFRFFGFGWSGGGFLVDPRLQSPKLIAVWTQLEPLPLVITRPVVIMAGLILFGMAHAFMYRWLSPQLREGIFARTVQFGGLIFLLSFAFFEFFTPFNMFGEPLILVAAELAFWACIAFGEAFALAAVMEWGKPGTHYAPRP